MSSTVIAKNVQIGADGTASNNFTIFQPATPDGTLRIGNGNTGITSSAVALTSAGNVGIGTSSPSFKLDVSGTLRSTGEARFDNAVNLKAATTNYVYYDSSLRLTQNGTGDRLAIDTSGNVGIGTSSPNLSGSSTALTVNTGTAGNYSALELASGGTLNYHINANNSAIYHVAAGTRPWIVYTNGSERVRISSAGGFSVGTTADPGAGAIYATGNITAYYSSDRKFKENIAPIPKATETICAIGGKLFDWTDEYIANHGGADGYFVRKEDFGVVAQDVLAVFPRAVRTREDGSLAVDYEKLCALAFAGFVEQQERIEKLEAALSKLIGE